MKKNPRITTVYSIIKHLEAQTELLHSLASEELALTFSEVSPDSWLKILERAETMKSGFFLLKPVLEEIETWMSRHRKN